MRISTENTIPPPNNPNFLPQLYKLLRMIIRQLNSLTEGQIQAVTNATTAAPTTGSYQQGDKVWNTTPTELGAASSKYVILGWVCVAAGSPGTWVEMRTLTGN
jgi:hypothetical protein